MVQITGGEVGQFLGQRDGGHMGRLEEGVVIGQFVHLPCGDLAHLFAAIAKVHTPQPRHRIEDFIPLAVGQIDALGPCDDARALVAQFIVGGERMHMMRRIKRLKVRGGEVIRNGRHVCAPSICVKNKLR